MSYRIRSMTTVVLGSLLVLAMFSTAAFAQYPTAEAFGVGCTPERQVAGQLTTCTVVGAVPGETLTVTVRAGNTLVLSETLTADEDGRASFSFTVPEGRAAVVIRVVGSISGPTSTTLLPAEAAGRAVDRARGDLPRTGQDTAILVLGGVLLLAVGGGAVARSRRRNEQHADA
jgi:LPXTG-motif cell wall-anchored protein